MKCCNAYESDSMVKVMGETLRPGGFSLTEKAIQFCKLSGKDAVLDLGCGRGATVNYLHEIHHIRVAGVDPSEKLIDEARRNHSYARFFIGSGENIPSDKESFHCVFAECTLSLMNDLELTLKEVCRILKPGGWFVISDVYAKNPDAVPELNPFTMNSCMRGLHELTRLKEILAQLGFSIEYLEDCSGLLKEMMVKTIFTFGSMSVFWNLVSQNCADGCKFEEALKHCKPGYFLMIAKKR